MSYRYATRDRSQRTAPKKETAPQPSADALSAGLTAPQAQLGHRVDLPELMRARMENAFGADLSAVRLYESQAVADAGAKAVTRGADIAFAPGLLDFSSYGGQALLGHELSHVVSQARGEATGSGFLNDYALEARADREGAMAASGQQIAMPAAAMSAVTAAPAAGPMQAKKDKDKAKDALDHMSSDGRSKEGNEYFEKKFGSHENHGELTDSHKFRLFLRQSYGKSDAEKDELYSMYTDPQRREDYLAHVRGLVDQSMAMDMDQFNLQDKKRGFGKKDALLKGAGKVNDAATDIMALSDVLKDEQASLGYDDKFVQESFGARRQYLMATKANTRGRLREVAGEQAEGATAKSPASQIAFGETGVNQGFADFKSRYIEANRKDALKGIAAKYNPVSNEHSAAATPEQRAAGKAYIRDSRDINAYLRTGQAPDSKKAELDKMSADISGMMHPMQEDTKSYRSISDVGLLPLIEQAGLTDVVMKENGTIDHEKLQQHMDQLKGMTFQDKAFVSTTAAPQFAEKWGAGLGRRDLNFFKKRAMLKRGFTPEERQGRQKDLIELAESGDLTVAKSQQAYGALADELLSPDQQIRESDIGTHMMHISMPKGTKASFIDATSTGSGQVSDKTIENQQMEMLLDKGSRFRISDIVQKTGEDGKPLANQYHIFLELLQEEAEEEGKSPDEVHEQALDMMEELKKQGAV